MGRRKSEEIVEDVENLEEPVSEETEVQEEALAEESEEAEEKPKRQRRARRTKAEIVAAEEAAPPTEEGSDNAEVVCEEVVEDEKPKRQRNSRKKPASPEAQIELATEAMQKTMDEMVKHWTAIQSITGTVSSQLEKVAHIVKPSIQDFVSTNDSLVQPKKESSQFAMRFTAAASIVAVLLSLVSLSLSQSARTVALNAEATRVASSQLFQTQTAQQPRPEVAFQPSKDAEVFGPRAKSRTKSKKF